MMATTTTGSSKSTQHHNARVPSVVPNTAVTTTTTKDIFQGQPKDELWKNLSVPILDWDDVGIDCFLGRGAFTHVHKGKIKLNNRKHHSQKRTKTMSSIESTVAMSQSSSLSVDSSSSSIESIPLDDTDPSIENKPQSVDSVLLTNKAYSSSSTQSQSSSSHNKQQQQQSSLCAIKCINPTKTKRKEALLSASNDLLNEAILLAELSHHENFVNFLGILPQEVVDDDDDDDEESNNNDDTTRPPPKVQDYVLVLECLDETLSARLKRWRKEQLQMQKQQQEIWMAQELVLEQRDRLLLRNLTVDPQQHPNAPPMGRGRRLGTGVRNLWRRLNHHNNNGGAAAAANNHNNNGRGAATSTATAGRRGRWGRLLNRGGGGEPANKNTTPTSSSLPTQQPQPQDDPTMMTNHDTSTRVEDYRELVNSETNEFRWKQMNERMETIVLGIVAGMKHMHDHQIVHRDLKPQNIGFCLETQKVKLFDFGLARNFPYNVQTASTVLYYSQRRRSSLGSTTAGNRRRSNSIGSGGNTTNNRSNSIGNGNRRRSNSIGNNGNRNLSIGNGNRRRSNSIGSRRSSNNNGNGGGSFDVNNIPPNPTIGEVVGTWRYMAPETMRSMGSDYASDVFSFAIMWSEICTLQRPYFNDEDDEDDELIHPAAASTAKRSTTTTSEKKKKNRYGPYENWNHLKSCILEEGHRPNLTSLPKHSTTSDLQMWINQCWDPEPYRRPTFDSLHQLLLEHYCNKEHPPSPR